MSDVHDRIRQLEEQLAQLKAEVDGGHAPVPIRGATPPTDEPVNRRSALKKTGAAIAGVAAGAVVLSHASPAAAIDGSNMVIGTTNTGTTATELHVTGTVPRVLFLVNESGFTPDGSAFPTALAAWGDANHYGIYGWSPGLPGVVASSGSSDVAALQLATRAAPPAAGAHSVGEFQTLANGALFVCSEAGTPGTWSNVGFNSVTPTRFLDTRSGIGLSGQQGAGDANVRTLAIGGRTVGSTRVPASATAVAVTITVTNPTDGGFITIWNTGVTRPDASNANFLPDDTVANFGILKLGTSGNVSLFNFAGGVDILIDVAGYFI